MLAVGFDRQRNVLLLTLLDTFDNGTLAVMDAACATSVSYTHLTLPTILLV